MLNRFIGVYKQNYGEYFIPLNKSKDMRQLLLVSRKLPEEFTMEDAIVEYISSYDIRFKNKNFPTPTIYGLMFNLNSIVDSLRKHADSEDIPWA